MTAVQLLSPHPLLTDGVRLRIMGLLSASETPISFNDMIEVLKVTKGNLSTHMARLESEGLVEVKKQFINKKPLTTYVCTDKGRKELNQYLEQIQAFLESNQKNIKRRT